MIDSYEKLNIGFDKIDQILHVADIHVRLTTRHDEYREAFQKLYDYVDTKLSKNSIIAILGDSFHSKLNMAPESIQLVSEFFRKCADRRPTIVIAGNHDCLLTNKTRLDSISPIVDNIAHKNLFYLKESKLYGAGNILFNNFSIFDDPSKYIKIRNITKRLQREFDIKIALFHGPVHAAKTDIGFTINNKSITAETFDGHDIALLGDIHLAQTMYIEKEVNKEDILPIINSGEWEILCNPTESTPTFSVSKKFPILRFSSSFLQQNFGESLKGHGFSVWNISTRSFEHIEISNDYGYFTILIDNGKLITDISDLPKKAKLRVQCRESVATEVKRVITDIRKTHTLSELVYVRLEDASTVNTTKTISNLSQIGNVDYQNKLIGEYLKDKFPDIDESTLDSVFKINNTLNSEINKDDRSRNIRWKPKRLEFDNLFSYGEGNVLDFTKLSDVYGIFSANASGKSSLMSILSFIAFDKSDKAYKASHIINTKKMNFRGKFTFEVNDVEYCIIRSGTRDKKNNVKVDVNFYKIVGGEEVPLNAEARRSTNEIIRDFLGNYDDFILTSLSLQNNRGSFVDMGQTERKELLSQFIGITLFDKLTSTTNEKIKELTTILKAFNKEDNTSNVAKLELEFSALSLKVFDLELSQSNSQLEVDKINEEIESKSKSITNLLNVPSMSEASSIKTEKIELIDKVSNAKEKIESWKLTLENEKIELDQLMTRKNELSLMSLSDKKIEINNKTKRYNTLDKNLSELKYSVSEKLKKLAHLELHKYDPNCSFCMDNIFVKDAKETRNGLENDKLTVKSVVGEMKQLSAELRELEKFQLLISEMDCIQSKISEQNSVVSKKQLDVNSGISMIDRSTTRLIKINEQLDLYSKSKDILEINAKIEREILELKAKLSRITNTHKELNKELLTSTSRKVSVSDKISNINTKIEEIEKYQDEVGSYEYYLSAIGPSGLQYKIISNAVPQIESDVNNILSQIVEFTLEIETDGKNINVFIKYDDGKWPLELCSGMEKFISGLALRVALIRISNMPRPNFICIDEGMSSLDAENIPMMHALFDYLKTNFDFIIVISHLDIMRDMVEKQLEIYKENGFSKIDNSK